MSPEAILGAVALVASAVAGAAYLIRGLWRMSSKIHRVAEDILGDKEADKPGVVARLQQIDLRLGVFDERLASVEHQVNPNSGSSLYDKVNKTNQDVTAIKEQVTS